MTKEQQKKQLKELNDKKVINLKYFCEVANVTYPTFMAWLKGDDKYYVSSKALDRVIKAIKEFASDLLLTL